MSGEFSALCAAFCWAVAARYFRRLGSSCPSLTLNIWKGIIATPGLLILAVWLNPEGHMPARDVILLLAGGILGIGLGDSCFFASVNRVGDRVAVLITETVAPVAAILLAAVFLGEWLSPLRYGAVLTIVLGVAWSVRKENGDTLPRRDHSGMVLGLGAAFFQAAGIVISREVMSHTTGDAALSAAIRLAGGLLILAPLLLLSRQPGFPRVEDGRRPWWLLIATTIGGTLIALGLMMHALASAEAGVVQTLIASSAIFSLFLNWLAGEQIGANAIYGSITALAGVAMLLLIP